MTKPQAVTIFDLPGEKLSLRRSYTLADDEMDYVMVTAWMGAHIAHQPVHLAQKERQNRLPSGWLPLSAPPRLATFPRERFCNHGVECLLFVAVDSRTVVGNVVNGLVLILTTPCAVALFDGLCQSVRLRFIV